MTLTAPIDGCPECLTHARSFAAEPHAVHQDGTSLVAHYMCGECGYVWRTWWNPIALEDQRREDDVA